MSIEFSIKEFFIYFTRDILLGMDLWTSVGSDPFQQSFGSDSRNQHFSA